MHQIAVSLEDLYKGKTSKLAVTRNIICSKCTGYAIVKSYLLFIFCDDTTIRSLYYMIPQDMKSSL